MKVTYFLAAFAAVAFASGGTAPPPPEDGGQVADTVEIAAKPCYGSGVKFGSKRRAAISYAGQFCAGPGDNRFRAGQTKHKCYNHDNGNRLNLYLQRTAPTAASLHRDTCNQFFQRVINGCSRGGRDEQDGWYFRADPNKGSC